MELQVSSMLPLSFRQVVFYFCLELTGVIIRSMPERASEAIRERTRERASERASGKAAWKAEVLSFPAPRARVSCRVRLSRDFLRLSQMESLLAG